MKREFTSEFVSKTKEKYTSLLKQAQQYKGKIKYADLAVIVAARDLSLNPGAEEIEVLADELMKGEQHGV